MNNEFHLIEGLVVPCTAASLTEEQRRVENEVHSRFNALYYGQTVFKFTCNDKEIPAIRLDYGSVEVEFGYLLLRRIEQITPEERLQVGILAYPMFLPFPEKDYDTLRRLALTVLDKGHLGSRVSDLLRSLGVLVPFTTLTRNNEILTLSSEDIITLGWAQYSN